MLLYIMLAYIMPSNVLLNAVCLYNTCLYFFVYVSFDDYIVINYTMLFVY